MFNVKAIREDIAAKLNRVKAIRSSFDGEDIDDKQREAMKAEAESILAEIGNSGADGEPKTGLYADLATAERIESIEADLSATSDPVSPVRENEPAARLDVRMKRSRANLKAYNRNDNRSLEDAYKAGRWLSAVLFNDSPSKDWLGANGMGIRAAQSEGSNQKGGFLVPDELSQAIIDLREQYGVFRQHARVVNMSGDHMVIPRRKSGVTAYAVGEAAAITESDKEWNQVELTAKKWGALVKYSSELAEDAFIDLADDLADEMAWAFSKKEDESGFIGDGTSTYHGISGVMVKVSDGNHAGSIYTAATGNTAFSTLDLADFHGALGSLPHYVFSGRRAAWFISQVGYYESMARLMDAGGGNSNVNLAAGTGLMFLGLPVVISQTLNSTTTAQTSTNLIAVGDLSLAATVGDRRDFSVMVSSDRYFENDQIGIKGTQRTAINVHDLGDSTDAGPVVVIRTPAS